MQLRFTLADKISMTIIIVGIFGIMLVYYISESYKQFAYKHHTQAIQQLTYLKIDDLILELKDNSLDLALSIENEKKFQQDFQSKNKKNLTQLLDNQFYQYFVTAGIVKLLKLYILDTNFTLISTSTEGMNVNIDGGLICPSLSQYAIKRIGSEKLQTLSLTCIHENRPVYTLLVPFGGLNPKGYIQVVTDLSYSLQKIDQSLAKPIQIDLLNQLTVYQSTNWNTTEQNNNYLDVRLPVKDENNKAVLFITLKSDMTGFNKEIKLHRNWIMALALVTTALTVFIVLLVLQRSTVPKLAKIHDALQKIHLHTHSHDNNNNSHVLFEQLLEQIIHLKKQTNSCFSVMIIDLTRFKNINIEFGNSVGDTLLLEVEQRLSTTLRDSDLISWIGTDTPGHKLLPTDTKTRYRATLARLGGDEFGLLLPSAETKEQAVKAAKRIAESLNEPFEIDGHQITIRCKIGISIFPKHGDDENILIRNADKAMHLAKENKQTISVFEPA